MNKDLKKTTKALIEGIILSLKDSPKSWKTSKPGGWEVNIRHRTQKIRLSFSTNRWEPSRFKLIYKNEMIHHLPFLAKHKLIKQCFRVYRAYRTERRLLKINKVIEDLQ